MSRTIRQRGVLLLVLGATILAGACSAADVSAPHQAHPRAPSTRHDDDPATCRSGYTIIDGRVVCNPDTR